MMEHPPFRKIKSPYRDGNGREKVYYFFCGILPVHKHLTEDAAEECWKTRTQTEEPDAR
jgi:hypothetical protein